jgi:hypothetical protein
LANPNDVNDFSPEEPGLLMNSLNGDLPCADCGDTDQGELNLLPVDNLTDWHEFWITIQLSDGGEGSHDVTVYADGSTEGTLFAVTAGVRADGSDPLTQGPLSIGLPGTAHQGAFDLDFISYAPGVLVPTAAGGEPALEAGDADMNYSFDQLDLVRVQVAAKYLTGQPATWGEGDWNGAPGGSAGDPPPGDNQFNQLDIIAALNAGKYLTGPYAALSGPEGTGDGNATLVYDATTGELAVEVPGTELTSINIQSAASIFTGDSAENLGGDFDNDSDDNIFKATFGTSFGSLSFGTVAQAGLSEEFVIDDLTAVGSLAGGGELGAVDLRYVPEPSAVVLLVLAALGLMIVARRR